MDAWIYITLAAAFVQTLRFMVQKQLTTSGLSTGGATLARFLYAAPLAIAALALVTAQTGATLPALSPRFWAFALLGGLSQILATLCVVALFKHRNFAVGITFKKTEVLLTVIVGFLILGDTVSWPGAVAMFGGFSAVLLLSDPPDSTEAGWTRFFNRAVGLGLLSGVFFALSGVGYRGTILALDGDSTLLRTLVSLSCVTLLQTATLGTWLIFREPGQVRAVLASWKSAGFVGIFSVLGSGCWFAAFSMQTAAYVFALGQVELIFSALIGYVVFREKITRREALGMTLLSASVVALVAVV
ncbi:MAG: DMT family transporter [Rhodobacteraceae bacterium]|nr:DMT family transporter [Paracoccaceae bacterium]